MKKTNHKMRFPETLKHYRILRGYSQREVAEAAGITRQGYGNIEKRGTQIKVGPLYSIARLLRVNIADLLPD